MRFDRIYQLAKDLVDLYQTRDPWELADILGIAVSREKLPRGTLGVKYEYEGEVYIFIDESLDDIDLRHILAHELFHHIDSHPGTHILYSGHWGNWYETQADYFAACLLIDEEPMPEETDLQLAARLGVPLRLVHLLFGMTA